MIHTSATLLIRTCGCTDMRYKYVVTLLKHTSVTVVLRHLRHRNMHPADGTVSRSVILVVYIKERRSAHNSSALAFESARRFDNLHFI